MEYKYRGMLVIFHKKWIVNENDLIFWVKNEYFIPKLKWILFRFDYETKFILNIFKR